MIKEEIQWPQLKVHGFVQVVMTSYFRTLTPSFCMYRRTYQPLTKRCYIIRQIVVTEKRERDTNGKECGHTDFQHAIRQWPLSNQIIIMKSRGSFSHNEYTCS